MRPLILLATLLLVPAAAAHVPGHEPEIAAQPGEPCWPKKWMPSPRDDACLLARLRDGPSDHE